MGTGGHQSVEEIQALSQSIIDSSDDAIISKTLDGIITSWNHGAEILFGYNSSEVIGKHISILIPDDRLNEELEIIGKIKRGENVKHYETERKRKDGSLVNISLTVSPVKEIKGKIIGASKIARDITERIEMEGRLRKSLLEIADYKYALDESSILAITDQKGVIKSVNDNFCKISKYNREELIGQDHRIINSNYHTKEFIRNIWTTIANGKIWKGELRNRAKDGTIYWVDTTIVPFLNEQGKPYQYVAIRADITQRKEFEEKIIKSNRLYAFLSAINQSIVHSTNEQELTDKACVIATDIGQFKTAWIGLLDADNRLNMLSIKGDKDVVEEVWKYSGLDSVSAIFKTTTMGEVIATGRHVIKNDVQNDPSAKPFIEIYVRFGIKATITFPIKKFGKTIGVFGFHSVKESFFDKEEVGLLGEAAIDISFALENFEKEESRLRIEAEVLQNEEMMKEAQRLARLGSLEADFEKNTTKWSDELYKILGYEVGEVEASLENLLNRVHPDDVERVRNLTEDAIARLNSLRREFRLKMKDGTIKFIESELWIERNKENKAIRVSGFSQDVTERKRAEENLKQSETRFREFFDAAPEALVVLDITTGTFIRFNDNALKLVKYSAEELIKKGPADVSPPFQPDGSPSDDRAKEFIVNAMNGGKPVFEWLVIDSEEKEIMTEVRLVSLSNTMGPQILASFIDITERKNAERIQKNITNDIIQRNKDLEQFSYIVSHNLRLPVANIIGLTNASQNENLEPEIRKEVMEGLSQSARKLDEVIIDLNNILKIRREVSEKKEIVSFSLLVVDIKSSIENLVEKEKAIIAYDFSEIDEMLTHKSYLNSIFYNLISNSIKYHQPGIPPVIEIKSHNLKNKIQLLFKDNGMGIDLKRKGDQVFGLYKRFHTESAEGKGMGLYMVKTQVETIGGKISIESEVNKGTVFKIELEI